MTDTIKTIAPMIGDIVFTRWAGFDSKLTEWVTSGRAAHEEQVYSDGDCVKIISASKVMNRIVIWEWESRKAYFRNTKTEWCRFTPANPLTEEQRRILHDVHQEAENTFKYSKAELVLQALDSLNSWLFKLPYDSEKAVKWRKLGNVSKSDVICSKVANIGLVRLGFLPAWAIFWSPSDTLHKLESSTSWVLAEATEGFFKK